MQQEQQNLNELPKSAEVLYLPLPKSAEQIRSIVLHERLRQRKERYLEGLERFGTAHAGMQYAGIKNRSTICRYRQNDDEFLKRENAIFDDLKLKVIDIAETKLIEAMQSGEGWAIRFLLERLSDKYRQKSDISISTPLEIEEHRKSLILLLENVKSNIANPNYSSM